MDKYIIYKWYPGKFGYKTFFQLMQWNSVYKHYYSIKDALALEFIKSYCVMHGIDYDQIKVKEITRDETH